LSQIRRSRAYSKRTTIGLLALGIPDTNARNLWAGVAQMARERDANLICFLDTQTVSPYGLASHRTLGGVIVCGGWHVGDQVAARAFHDRHRSLPMVSIGLQLEAVPTAVVDGDQGVHSAINHLVKVHGFRRIAFLRGLVGQLDSDLRYQAYVDTLNEHGIPFDPGLVFLGDEQVGSGEEAVRKLLDERRWRPGIDVQAIVADDDHLALSASRALRARGFGDRVAIVGFGDIDGARSAKPPLTTVRIAAREQGRRAAQMLFVLINNAPVPQQVTVPTSLVVRQSCGCPEPADVGALSSVVVEAVEPSADALVARRASIVANIVQAIADLSRQPVSTRRVRRQVESLVDAFLADVHAARSVAPAGHFLPAWAKVLASVSATAGDPTLWELALSTMCGGLLPCLHGDLPRSRAEHLWQQAWLRIDSAVQRALFHACDRRTATDRTLHQVGQAIHGAMDVHDLSKIVSRELPRLGIPGCYLALYDRLSLPLLHRSPADSADPQFPLDCGSPPPISRLVLAYDARGPTALPAGGRRFPSYQLVPDDVLSRDQPYSLVVKTLSFRAVPLGFVAFEMGPLDEHVYEVLSGQLGSSLGSILATDWIRSPREALWENRAA
jgi:DNA-binding LacI/PurR family transcriptional regulator